MAMLTNFESPFPGIPALKVRGAGLKWGTDCMSMMKSFAFAFAVSTLASDYYKLPQCGTLYIPPGSC
jgi:hypothetical protein